MYVAVMGYFMLNLGLTGGFVNFVWNITWFILIFLVLFGTILRPILLALDAPPVGDRAPERQPSSS